MECKHHKINKIYCSDGYQIGKCLSCGVEHREKSWNLVLALFGRVSKVDNRTIKIKKLEKDINILESAISKINNILNKML